MSILVIAEHDNTTLNGATRHTLAAAQQIGSPVNVLVAGSDCEPVANEVAKLQGVETVLLADNAAYEKHLAENIAPLVAELASDYGYVLASATTTGKNLMPRVAALLDVDQLSDVIEVVSADTFKRPVYAGNIIATVKNEENVKVLTVRGTAFDAVSAEEGDAEIKKLDSVHENTLSAFVSESVSDSDRPDLTAASVVVSGGRGMQNGENFRLLETIADKLGGAVGASRAAVDAGFVANDMQVGQTGKIVAPELYMAVGISGAIQHLAGMKDSKVIVAINKDEEAPIFQVADYGLVADLFDALPALAEQL